MATTIEHETERNAAAIRAFAAEHDPSWLAPDAVFEDAGSGMTWTGPEAIAGMLHWFYAVAFDAHLEDADLRVEPDGRSAELSATFAGTHLQEFAGIPASGRVVRVPLSVTYRMAGGLVTGARFHFDVATFVAQATE